MNAEIVAIGSELLLGQIVDTNSAWMAQRLASLGVNLYYKTVVGDNPERMLDTITGAMERSDVVITSGGIGPTQDDLTREIVARASGRELVLDRELLSQIETRFRRRGLIMTENNNRQAYIPAGSIPVEPKVRIASSGDDSFSRVGRLGFPIFLSMRGMDVNELETNLKDYHKAWKEAGHPGEAGDVSVRFPMYIAPTDEDAVEEPKESIEAYFQRMRRIFEDGFGGGTGAEYQERRRRRIEHLESLTWDDILETKVIVGSPERVIERLTQFKEMLGLTGFTAELNPGGLLPKEAVHRSLKLLTQEVMPAFK